MPDVWFLTACLLVFLSHAAPSWPGVRERLRQKLGRGGFAALHGIGSTVTLALLVFAYGAQDDRSLLYAPPVWAPVVVVALTPLAFVLAALRLVCPPGEIARPRPPSGVYRLTAAPGAVGVLLWAALHVFATGDGVRLTLFATLGAIAVFSLWKNRYVMSRAADPAARAFVAATALTPGLALLTGRQGWVGAEWRAARPRLGIAAGLAGWAVMLALHPRLFGVDPLGLALMTISFGG